MKKLLAFFISLMLIFSLFSFQLQINTVALWEGDFEIRAVDGYAEIIGCAPDISGDVVIPDFFGGYCITNIGIEAFRDATGITSVTIGEFVSVISYNAFKGCTNLETVNFKSTHCSASGSAERPIFEGCTKLKTVNIDAAVTKIPKFMFYGVASLETVNFAGERPKIGQDAFWGCPLIDLDEEPASSLPASSKPTVSRPAVSSEPISSKPISSLVSSKEVISEVESETPSEPTDITVSVPVSNDGGNSNTLIFVWIGAAVALVALAAVTTVLLKK